jgi:alpha-D-xyloside xylohydrolase
MQRSHGSSVKKEIYNLGKKGDWVYDSEERYINLRYRLLPYLYSTAWEVTSSSASFLRALFMDFNADTKVHNTGNEYMFGKAFLVTPVTDPMYVSSDGEKWENPKEDFSRVKTQAVYLPQGASWIDFWTGETFTGGQTLNKETPIDIIPLYVRAGAIVPFAPRMQYAAEKKWDRLEIRIYPGADGEFVLYEDENDNYNYEKGAFSTIRFVWNEKNRTLTIQSRKGSFAGMIAARKFWIVLVSPANGTGDKPLLKANAVISYSGKEKTVKIP